MNNKQYHCFWTNPYGNAHHYKIESDEKRMLELVALNNIEDSEVRELTVVYGEALEFEPVKIIDGWRVKQK